MKLGETKDNKTRDLKAESDFAGDILTAEPFLCWLFARVSTFYGFTFTTLLLGARSGLL